MSNTLQEESVALAFFREAKLKCLSAASHSWVGSLLLGLFDRHRWHTVFARQSTRLNRLVDSSGSYRLYDASTQQLTIAAKTAVLTSFIAFCHRAVRSSALYQWLTTEPDPNVIVIDLRETWTVGPIINGIDWFEAVFLTATRDSVVVHWVHSVVVAFRDRPIRIGSITVGIVMVAVGLFSAMVGSLTLQTFAVGVGVLLFAVMGFRSTRSLAEVCGTPPVKLLVAAFEPPETPESPRDTTEQAVDAKSDDSRSDKGS